MLRAPIKVYIKNQQGSGYLCIVHYGEKFDKANGGKRKPVRLLYNGSNQYVLSFPFFHLVRLGQLHRKAALRIADRRRLCRAARVCGFTQLRPPPRSVTEPNVHASLRDGLGSSGTHFNS